MKTSCRYTGIVIGVLVLVILISGCMYGDETNLGNNTSHIKTYSAYNISFNYSSNWYAYNATTGSNNVVPGDLPLGGDVFTSNTNRSNNNDMIFVVSKDDVTVFDVQIIPTGDLSEQEGIKLIKNSMIPDDWNKLSNGTLTIDGKTAYEDIYTAHDQSYNEQMRYEVIYLIKNGKTYYINMQAPDKEFDKEKSNFNIIINSFKVQ
ncbi:MAG: photosystem II reaction center PsbP family protein [Methanobacterium paludis]|nr:photosystem II reaction center PsbP family protein [Methanobacterium paludis]